MNRSDHENHKHEPAPGFWKSRAGLVLISFFVVAGGLLAYEHRVHLFAGNGFLVVLLAVCIGMHIFMHGGHGGHGGGKQ